MVQGRRPRIFGLFAVAAVDAGALFAYETGWRSDAAPERGAVRVNTNLAALAEGAARRLAAALDEQWRLHQSVAAALQPWGPERDGAAAQAKLDELQLGRSHLTWMGVADAATGRVQAATRGILAGGADVSARPWFMDGRKGAFAGDVHDAVLLQRALRRNHRDEPLRLIDYATPLRDEAGGVVAVLGAHLDWEWIRGLLRDTPMPEGVQLVLLSSSGAVMFGPGPAFEVAPSALQNAPVNQIAGAPSFGWSIAAVPVPR